MASPYRLDSEGNMFETLGRDKIVELSTAFYTRVYTSPNEEFRAMFKNPIEDAIQDQYGAKLYFCDVVCKPSYRLRAAEFFIQRFGGQPLYSERKGHPALRFRHVKFHITRPMADLWIQHMRDALDEVGIEGDTKDKLVEFFTDVAYFLQNVDDDGNRIYGQHPSK